MATPHDPIPEPVYHAVAVFERATCDLDAVLQRHAKLFGARPHAILNTALEAMLDALDDVRTAHRSRAGLHVVKD
jgi:hypothetical protein